MMITIEEAINRVKSNSQPLNKKTVKLLEKASSYMLFDDVVSPINMPPFNQSAMDGYALHVHDGLEYAVIGEVKAGDAHQLALKAGEAVRIFTGAPVPDSANAVVMQEKVMRNDSFITIDAHIKVHCNIRPEGEQIQKGDIALKKGTKLTPAAIGFLSSLGIKEVSVYKKPVISIVTTGNELIHANETLTYGKIYESNSKMLQSALYQLKYYDLLFVKIDDDYKTTVQQLNNHINKSDLVIITGGISVGDYDFVGKALTELQVKELFYKVKQKPGKPLYFGKKVEKLIFALPGNPAAALTCFYVYVYMALQQMMNSQDTELPRLMVKSISSFSKNGDRPQFLKAFYKNDTVEILDGQSSAMQQSFAISNALVYLPESILNVEINDMVETILLPL